MCIRDRCYDREGYRLGFGGGYYDRWLAGCSGWKVGLCRAALLQDRLPRGPYDIPVLSLIHISLDVEAVAGNRVAPLFGNAPGV